MNREQLLLKAKKIAKTDQDHSGSNQSHAGSHGQESISSLPSPLNMKKSSSIMDTLNEILNETKRRPFYG